MKKYKLIKQSITSVILLTTMIASASCAKDVPCDIENNHVHLYRDVTNNLTKYISGEKESVGNYIRENEYELTTPDVEFALNNNLCLIKDNELYLNYIGYSFVPSRQAYEYGYVYGSYYGYGYKYNPTTNKTEYTYGYHVGWHNGYEWKDIPLDEYTKDKVRDITYKFRFYKKNDDGTLSSEQFDSMDDIPSEYLYFKDNDLVVKYISDSYRLNKNKQLTY